MVNSDHATPIEVMTVTASTRPNPERDDTNLRRATFGDRRFGLSLSESTPNIIKIYERERDLIVLDGLNFASGGVLRPRDLSLGIEGSFQEKSIYIVQPRFGLRRRARQVRIDVDGEIYFFKWIGRLFGLSAENDDFLCSFYSRGSWYLPTNEGETRTLLAVMAALTSLEQSLISPLFSLTI